MYLSSGDDPRLRLNGERNAYGCTPYPDPNLLDLGACTASVVSAAQFAQAGEIVSAHSPDHWTLAQQQRDWQILRKRCLAALQLPDDTHLQFAASGTDLHHDFLARMTGQAVGVVSVSEAETGRGVPAILAQAQRYQTVALRHTDGRPRPSNAVDADFLQAVQATLAAGLHCVLIAVDVSKSGLLAPSLDCLQTVRRLQAVTVLVDACQFRLSKQGVAHYLAEGDWLALTGSKFMAGPSFSGMLLRRSPLPNLMLTSVEQGISPLFPENQFGLFLRVSLAVSEMERFFRLRDAMVAMALSAFTEVVEQSFARCQTLRYWPNPPLRRPQQLGACWDQLPSVFLFQICRLGQPVSMAEHQQWRDRALRGQISAVSPMLLGQAMCLGDGDPMGPSALRLSASARWVNDWIAASQNGDAALLENSLMTAILAFDAALATKLHLPHFSPC